MPGDRSGVPPRDAMPAAMSTLMAPTLRTRAAFPGVPRPVGHLLLLGSLPVALLAIAAVPPTTGPATAGHSVPSAHQNVTSATDAGQVPCPSRSRSEAGPAGQPATTPLPPEPGTDHPRQTNAPLLPGQRGDTPTSQTQAPPAVGPHPAPRRRAADDTTASPADKPSHSPSCCRTGPPHERDRVSTAPGRPASPRRGDRILRTPAPSTGVTPVLAAEGTWTLTSRRLVLRDAQFQGVVTVRTAAGAKRLLKFRVRSLQAADLDLTVRRGRSTWHLKAGAGTITGSPTTLYTEKLVGRAIGLGRRTAVPRRRVVISPSSVPHWLTARAPAARNARRRTVTIEGAVLYRIRLTGGSLKMPRPRLTTT
ncbi:hypothetical protein EDD90_0640 [Streptomyces sp. Ag109_O5-1]|nr:hypothetical protein EDD90_0640 [Streptomyces sp. Ag109_O5-1]